MKHLLDVNLLLATIWTGHPQHETAFGWLGDKAVAVCPLTELGFLRISTQPKAFNAPMEQARELLAAFVRDSEATWLADDLPALESHPKSSGHVTDHYLADLADKHGCKLATLDQGLKHRATVIVS
jgi:toxin-antitoxin system PIN domain toxin